MSRLLYDFPIRVILVLALNVLTHLSLMEFSTIIN